MEIDVKKYFKTHRDRYNRLFAIEIVGDERELIKEIRKQNEQLYRYEQAIDEIEELAGKIDDSGGCIYGDYNCDNCSCTYKVKKLILQKIREVE